ncbi:MAG: hypothetical protein QXT06_06850 [Candidatus Bathyarchaeia archaeon]
MILLYVFGSPVIGVLAFMLTIGSATLTGLGMPTEFLMVFLSLWPAVYSLGGFGAMSLFMATIFMLVLLSVGGGLMVLAIEYSNLLPAFKSLRRYDESFRKPLVLVEIGCIGPVMLLIGLVAMVMEASTGRPASTTPLLFWIGIMMLVIGQIGLAAGLFNLRRKLGDSRFSTAAVMFIINLLLSLALSMLAVIAGLAGWALTSPATRSVLKKKDS